MNDIQLLQAISAEWDTEMRSGFSFLRGLPSTDVWCFLDLLESHAPKKRKALLQCASKVGAGYVLGTLTEAVTLTEEETASWSHFSESIKSAKSAGFKYSSLRSLKMLIGFKRTGDPRYDRYTLPREIVDSVDKTASCKAPALRKLIKPMLAGRGFAGKNQGGGEWFYRQEASPIPCELSIDFGGMDSQLRYSFMPAAPARNFTFLSCERMLGITSGEANWNYITEEGCEQAVAHLGQCIDRVLKIIEQSGSKKGSGNLVGPRG